MVIEAFVDELDLRGLGFEGVVLRRRAVRPIMSRHDAEDLTFTATSTKSLRAEGLSGKPGRNVEPLMWLTGRLAPDFKTIADFRKDNGAAIRATCQQFVALCRKLNLFTQAMVAIDGSPGSRPSIPATGPLLARPSRQRPHGAS